MISKFPRYLGSFRITDVRGPQISYVLNNDLGQTSIRHVSHSYSYNERSSPPKIPSNQTKDPCSKAEPEPSKPDNYFYQSGLIYALWKKPQPIRLSENFILKTIIKCKRRHQWHKLYRFLISKTSRRHLTSQRPFSSSTQTINCTKVSDLQDAL